MIFRHDNAVSEIIGAILLIAIVVLAVGVVGVLLWSQPTPEKLPSLSAGISNQSCRVTITHNGGNTLERQTLQILVDGTDQTINFTKSGAPGAWTSWGIGEELVYDPPPTSCTSPKKVLIVYIKGNGVFILASGILQPFTVLPSLPRPYTHTITASAGSGGTIAPSGTVVVIDGASQSFTITANSLYEIRNISVDGVSQPASSGYTFTNIIADHTISATFGVAPPVAGFSGAPLSGPAPLSVTFTDSSTNTPNAWSWGAKNLTGNNTWFQFSTSPSPIQSFGVGNWSINLTATNAGGSNISTQVTWVNVSTTPPVASFTGTPTTVMALLPVTFTDTSLNTPTSWNWSFGDGSVVNATMQNPVHTYAAACTYTVSLNATNAGGSNTNTSNNYITVTPNPAWYNNNWNYRKNITIDKSKVPSDQSNFPVLISLTSDADLAARAMTNGNDILFTTSDGTTKLSHEIESYRNSTGALVAWVKVPVVNSTTSTANTIIYMYYGYSSAGVQQDPTNVWDSNYKAVWHLSGLTDAKGAYLLTNVNSVTFAATDAKINWSANFGSANTNKYLWVSDNLGITGGAITIDAWFRVATQPDSSGTYQYQRIVHQIDDTNDVAYNIGYKNNGDGTYSLYFDRDRWGVSGGVVTVLTVGQLSLNTWYHAVLTHDGTNLAGYFNGVSLGSKPATGSGSGATSLVSIGAQRESIFTTKHYFRGLIDEVRISNTARSAGWITTEYNNQNDPSTFYAVGSQEPRTC